MSTDAKRYTLGGRRKLYTRAEALAVASYTFKRTGVVVSIEEHKPRIRKAKAKA